MNSKLISQQSKILFFVPSLFALFLSMTCRSAAANEVEIKDTNYSIPSGAYFVSPNGSDSNSGKIDSPWTVAKAVKSAPTGSTIVFRGGIYRNVDSLAISKKLTLQPYSNEKAWIKGSLVVTDWVADGAVWRKDGWTYSFPPLSYMDSNYIDPEYPLATRGDMVYVNGVALKQVGSKAEVGPEKFYVDADNQRLYIGDNPAGKTVEATAKKQALNLWTNNGANSVLRGLGFAHYADTPLNVKSPNVTLENNTIAWNGVVGAKFGGLDGVIRGNIFSYNGDQGLGVDGADRILIEGNTFSYNNVEHFNTEWDSAGVKMIRTDRAIVRDNLAENNFATGIWFDISSSNATIVKNTLRHNEAVGIFFEISHKAIIAANIIYNNSIGILVSNSSSVRVYNNTLASNSTNMRVSDSKRDNTNSAEIAEGITWIARDNVVKNNILSNTKGGLLFSMPNCDTLEHSSLNVTAADYNAYYRQSSSSPTKVVSWSLGNRSQCSVTYVSIAAFKSATGYEAHALAVDNVATNPFFVDEANGNYRLKSGSQAIGYGVPLPADIASAIGLEAGVPVDLGALQSVSSLATR